MANKKSGKKKSDNKNKKLADEDLKSKLKKIVIEKPKSSENKKSEENKVLEESSENEDFNGINFTEDLRRVLSFKPSSQEVTYLGENLESSVKFAPRISRRKTEKGMDYSNAKYDANMYNENKYAEKTPDYTSGGAGTGENSPAEESSKGASGQ